MKSPWCPAPRSSRPSAGGSAVRSSRNLPPRSWSSSVRPRHRCRPTRSSRSATTASRRPFSSPRPARPPASSPRRPISTRRPRARRPRSRSSSRWPSIARRPRSPIWRSSSPSGSRTPRTDCSGSCRTYPTSRHIIPAREDLARIQLSYRRLHGCRGHHRRAREAPQGRRPGRRAARARPCQAGPS